MSAAKAPQRKLVYLVLPIDVFEHLSELALARGEEIEDTCKALLAAISEDDRAAHGCEVADAG